jgi:hypothetical protein
MYISVTNMIESKIRKFNKKKKGEKHNGKTIGRGIYKGFACFPIPID